MCYYNIYHSLGAREVKMAGRHATNGATSDLAGVRTGASQVLLLQRIALVAPFAKEYAWCACA